MNYPLAYAEESFEKEQPFTETMPESSTKHETTEAEEFLPHPVKQMTVPEQPARKRPTIFSEPESVREELTQILLEAFFR